MLEEGNVGLFVFSSSFHSSPNKVTESVNLSAQSYGLRHSVERTHHSPFFVYEILGSTSA